MSDEHLPASVIADLRELLKQREVSRQAFVEMLHRMGWYLECPACRDVVALDQPDFAAGWPGHCGRTMELRR